ncbi:MAG TPA: glycosyltransferase family 1 protein [Mycobacteriales bacterium]|nr:glycosyltransferase family 1 protein [Mycobacteriales bacterium]
MSGPHVAIDARWVQGAHVHAGVGRALAQVIPRIAAHPAIGAVTLLTDAAAPATGMGLPEVPLRSPVPQLSAVWLQVAAPRWLARHRDTVFHCDWYGLPYRQPVPMAATLHDILFEHRPEWYRRSRLAVFRAQARHAARTARCLIAPSEHVRADIAQTYDVDPARIVVAARSFDPIFRPDAGAPWLERPYVVALGGAQRRRLDIAVAAWRASGVDADLVVLGPPSELTAGDDPRLHAAGRLSDDDWARCLAGAEALLYPTEEEGFGLPALEAMASGTPVVCARAGSLPEVVGPVAAWVEEATVPAFSAALRALLGDDSRRARLRTDGIARAAQSSWERCADAYVEAIVRSAR